MKTNFLNFLNERLMNINDDVDLIYNDFFKNDIDKLNKTRIITPDMFEMNTLSTNYLISPLSKKTNKINPCDIIINHQNNFYNPILNKISITVNKNAINFVNYYDGKIDLAIRNLNDNKKINFKREFTESKIKGSIHHELVHWVDDTLHNNHISNKLKIASELNVRPNQSKIDLSNYEIQSQIHNIVQLKRLHEDEWDTISFDDMLKLSPLLNIINNRLSDSDNKKWKRKLLSRMFRENLLGKNMI